jgi:preprotein translocase subunit YajC
MDVLMDLLGQTTPPGGAASPFSLFPFALLLGVMVFLLLNGRSQRNREKREKENMHAKMAKNDRVLTIGGIIGTVMSVKDNEVVVKVDETTNTKMTFIKTAIQRILTDDQPATAEKR